MTDLTKGNIFDSLYFMGTCVQPYASASGLASIQSECLKAVQRAQDLTAPRDAAHDALHTVQAQRDSLADMVQAERTAYEGTGSLIAFREHDSHVRMAAKRTAVDALGGGLMQSVKASEALTGKPS